MKDMHYAVVPGDGGDIYPRRYLSPDRDTGSCRDVILRHLGRMLEMFLEAGPEFFPIETIPFDIVCDSGGFNLMPGPYTEWCPIYCTMSMVEANVGQARPGQIVGVLLRPGGK